MKVLHSDAPQSPLGDIYHVLEEELKCKVNQVFASFEDKPIGAASLAQVHKATLHDGRVVAVKVQHRDVQKHAAVDMATLEVSSWIHYFKIKINVVSYLSDEIYYMFEKKKSPEQFGNLDLAAFPMFFNKFDWILTKFFLDFSCSSFMVVSRIQVYVACGGI